MKFGYTILYVDDVEATTSFYEQAFGMRRKMVLDEYGELDTGETTLAFVGKEFARSHHTVPVQKGGPSNDAAPIEIALVTVDVPAAYAKAVAAGATPLESPAQKPWGQMVGYVRDNNGFLVELCSPVG